MAKRSPTFERRYRQGVIEEDNRPERFKPPTTSLAMGMPRAPFALKGCLLSPTGEREDAWIVVVGTAITEVRTTEPTAPGLLKLDTEGRIILPSLIDLHGHPEYNVFAAWEPPQQYINRYQWRGSQIYRNVVRSPWDTLTQAPSLLHDLTRYAEIRALIGGVTAIQGASSLYPGKEEALVRNVDLRIFGQHKARALIDPKDTPPEKRARLIQQIANGEVTALYVHLAEGKRSNQRSRNEFQWLKDNGLLTSATVIIHGTALSDADLDDVKQSGASLVWSPQSNLRLYGETTSAARALQIGIPMGIGADWLPSGSPSLLDELRVARRELLDQGATTISARQLVGMATWDAARIAGLGDHLGEIKAGRVADILVLERRFADPWENVLAADPSWVELVTIGGDLAYGRRDWMQALMEPDALADAEKVIAWGKDMILDTSYRLNPASAQTPPVRLSNLRSNLIARFPQIGPIFA